MNNENSTSEKTPISVSEKPNWFVSIYKHVFDEKAIIGTVLAIYCAFLLCMIIGLAFFESSKAEYTRALMKEEIPPLFAFIISVSISFLVVWLFQIKEGAIEIKLKGLEIKGPSCAMLLWCCGLVTSMFCLWAYSKGF